MRKLALIAVLVAIFVSCKDSKTVIKYTGGSITTADIDRDFEDSLYTVRKQEFDMYQQLAQQAVRKRIVEEVEKERGKKFDELLAAEVNAKFKPATEQVLRLFHKQQQIPEPYAKVQDRLRQFYEGREKDRIKQEFETAIFKGYEVEFVLEAPTLPNIDVSGEPFWGQENADVVIVEFSDFECPYCQSMQPGIRRIRKEYESKIKWVFKDFPLSFHAQARKAHIAANCAGNQDRYFDFQYKVFNAARIPVNGRPTLALGEKYLFQYAKEAKLKLDEFKTCLADTSGALSSEIDEDIRYGSSIGVRGTPTLYMNGEKINARDYNGIKAKIEAAL